MYNTTKMTYNSPIFRRYPKPIASPTPSVLSTHGSPCKYTSPYKKNYSSRKCPNRMEKSPFIKKYLLETDQISKINYDKQVEPQELIIEEASEYSPLEHVKIVPNENSYGLSEVESETEEIKSRFNLQECSDEVPPNKSDYNLMGIYIPHFMKTLQARITRSVHITEDQATNNLNNQYIAQEQLTDLLQLICTEMHISSSHELSKSSHFSSTDHICNDNDVQHFTTERKSKEANSLEKCPILCTLYTEADRSKGTREQKGLNKTHNMKEEATKEIGDCDVVEITRCECGTKNDKSVEQQLKMQLTQLRARMRVLVGKSQEEARQLRSELEAATENFMKREKKVRFEGKQALHQLQEKFSVARKKYIQQNTTLSTQVSKLHHENTLLMEELATKNRNIHELQLALKGAIYLKTIGGEEKI